MPKVPSAEDLARQGMTLTMQTRRLLETGTEMLGLRQNWISGEGAGVEFDLDCGAGLGSPILSLTVRYKGRRIVEQVDIREVAQVWAQRLMAEIDAAEEAMTREVEATPGAGGPDSAVAAEPAGHPEEWDPRDDFSPGAL